MPSHSSCTYDEYSKDLISSNDFNSWSPSLLEDTISRKLFGFSGGTVSVSVDQTPCTTSITCVDMMRIDEYTFELLVPVPLSQECERTVSFLLESKRNDMIVCMSNNSRRNILFALQGSVLCSNEEKATVYIPSIVKKSAWNDLNARGVECSRSGVFTRYSHHKVHVPPNLLETAHRLFQNSRKITMTSDHRPMVNDGYTHLCKVVPIIYIKAKSQRVYQDTLTNEPSDDIPERKIVVKVLNFMECLGPEQQ